MKISLFPSVFVVSLLFATTVNALSPQQVADGFVDGVQICLEASLKSVAVGDLAVPFKNRIVKADEGVRFMAGDNKSGPIWDVRSAQGNVLISESVTGKCEVISFGPPVEKTLRAAKIAILKRQSDFIDSGDKPDDYTPIRFGLKRSEAGQDLAIVLDGAEPGTVPGRFFRFSMLGAKFTRSQSVPVKEN